MLIAPAKLWQQVTNSIFPEGGSLLGGDVWRGSAWHVLLRSCALVGRVQALQKELVVALRVCRDTRSHLQVARHCNTESVLELFGFYS